MAIVFVVGAMAVALLKRARNSANESSAVASMPGESRVAQARKPRHYAKDRSATAGHRGQRAKRVSSTALIPDTSRPDTYLKPDT
jgi:hypothetical protein